MLILRHLLLLYPLLCCTGLGGGDALFAAAGDLDTSFNTVGFVRTDLRGDDHAYAMAVQPDGKFVVAGSTSSSDYSNTDFLVIRYNADGSLDSTFGSGGKVSTGIGTGNDIAFGVALQSDGKIVVAGETNDASATNVNFAVVRYTTTGALDTTFGTGGKVTTAIGTLDDFATCVAVQSDGKILVGGYNYVAADTTNFALARYTTTGALDTTFNSTGKVSTDLGGVETAEAVIVQSTGKILLAGSITNVAADHSDFALVRYNANGSLDTTFNSTGKVITDVGATYDFLDGIAVQSDGKIVAAGSLADAGIGLVRYNTNGSLDTSFNSTGKLVTALYGTGTYDSLHTVTLQGDGKILVAGSSRTGQADDMVLARFTTAGALDTTFGTGGKSLTNFSPDASSDYGYAISVLSDGGIMVAGDSTTDTDGYDVLLARFQSTGVAVDKPDVTALAASAVTGTTATLNGSVNAKGIASTISFEYGTSTAYGSVINATPSSLSSSTDTAVAANLTGLTEGMTYHFRVKVVTASATVEGADSTFTTTPAPPPLITLQPRSVTAEAGASFTLETQATGMGLTYQWQRNGNDLPDETAPTLTISSFQSTNAGSYDCVTTNATGISATTNPAMLSLVTSLGTALELTTARLQTVDPNQWTITTTGTHDGIDALMSGSPAVGGSSKLSAMITGPIRLNYFYKLTSTTNASFLRVHVDGVKASEFTGSVAWTAGYLLLPAGAHRVEFSFDQDAAGGAGEAACLDQLALVQPTWITTQPTSKIVVSGEAATLEVATDGLPTTYQWRKNGVAIPGETGPTLNRNAVTTSDAQIYTVALGTGLVSQAAALTVISGSRSARQPLTKTAVFTQTVTNGIGARFQWQRAGVDLIDGTKYAGTKTASLSVKLLTDADAGSDYSCTITLGSQTTTIGPCELSILPKPVITAVATQVTMISSSFSLGLQATDVPTLWTATGLPAGLVINSKTGVISGTPNAANKLTGPYTVIVTATNAAGASEKIPVIIDIAPLPSGLIGSFNGLVDRSVSLNAELGGSITATVTTLGTLTGTLRNGKDTHALNCRMVADSVNGTFVARQTIARAGNTPLVIALNFDPTLETLDGSISSNGQTANLHSARKPWTSTHLANDYAGLFNNALELPLANIGDNTIPQGTGYNQLNISTLGVATITGRTADGIVLIGSSVVAADGNVTLFQLLYTNKGSIHGRQRIALDGSVTSNVLTWLKTAAASATDKTYPNRFDVALSTRGARYAKPVTLSPIVLGLPDAADNASIEFTRGNIEVVTQFASLAQTFRVTKLNTTLFKTLASGNPCNVKMTITPTTGLFSGSFALTDPGVTKSVVRTVSFFGLLLSPQAEGVGYFLLPALAPATAINSGTVRWH